MEAVIGYSCRINCAAAGNEKVSLAPDDELCTNQYGVIRLNDLMYDLLCTTNRPDDAVRVCMCTPPTCTWKDPGGGGGRG